MNGNDATTDRKSQMRQFADEVRKAARGHKDDSDGKEWASLFSAADHICKGSMENLRGHLQSLKRHADARKLLEKYEEVYALGDGIAGVEMADIGDIESDPEVVAMFERNPAVVEALRRSVEKDGLHLYEPAKVWDRGDGKLIPYDWNTRADIVRNSPGITRIPIVKRNFASREEFLEAAVDEQINRRNLSVRDKFSVVKYLAPKESALAGGRHGIKRSAANSAHPSGRAVDIVGRRIGCSGDTVAKIRALLGSGGNELLERIFSEELSISAAFEIMNGRAEPAGGEKSESSQEESDDDDASEGGAGEESAGEGRGSDTHPDKPGTKGGDNTKRQRQRKSKGTTGKGKDVPDDGHTLLPDAAIRELVAHHDGGSAAVAVLAKTYPALHKFLDSNEDQADRGAA